MLANTYLSGTTPPMKVGTVVVASDGGEYVMIKATSTIAQFDAVIIINTSSATGASIGCVPVTTTNAATGQTLAVAQTAIASGDFGWVATKGHDLRVKTLISCQPAVPLCTTGTAGSLDDAMVTAGYCLGIVLMSSATSASAPPCVIGNAVIRTWGGA
jgi:hypothetical protein